MVVLKKSKGKQNDVYEEEKRLTKEEIKELKKKEPKGIPDYNKWLCMANKKKLYLTVKDFKSIPVNKKFYVFEPDYIFFGIIEGQREKRNYQYDPIKFFSKRKISMIKLGTSEKRETYTHAKDCCHVIKVFATYHDVIIDGEKRFVLEMPGDKIISNGGSGDGYSRYILIDKLKATNMPKFFILKTKQGYYTYY